MEGSAASITSPASRTGEYLGSIVRLRRACAFSGERGGPVVRQLLRLARAFTVNLVNQAWVLDRAGRVYPDEVQFIQTLETCGDFLDRHRALPAGDADQDGAALTSRSPERTEIAIENEAEKLVEKLKVHAQAINAFSLNILLGIALHDKEAFSLSRRRNVPALLDNDDDQLLKFKKLYERLYNKVVVFQNHQKRNNDPVSSRAEFVSILKDWRDILLESGLEEAEIPQIPVRSGRQALEVTAEQFKRAYMAEGGPSRHAQSQRSSHGASTVDTSTESTSSSVGSGERAWDNSTSSISRTFESRNYYIPEEQPATLDRTWSIATSTSSRAPSVFSSGPSPLHTGFSDVALGMSPSNIRKGSVEKHAAVDSSKVADGTSTQFDGRLVALDCYEVRYVSGGSVVTWNKGKSEQVEHWIPPGPNGYPLTSRPEDDESVKARFLGDHDVYLEGATVRTRPSYTFPSTEDVVVFQSAIRRLRLLHTFEAESLLTSVSPRPGESTEQQVKIWKNEASGQCRIAYFANNVDEPSIREFPVRWFDRPGSYSKSRKPISLRLNFVKPKRTNSGESRRPSDATSPSTPLSGGWANLSQSPAASDGDPSSTVLDEWEINQAPSILERDMAERFKFLDVVFAEEDERDRFLEAFTEAFDQSFVKETRPSGTGKPAAVATTAVATTVTKTRDPQARRAERATPMGMLGLTLTMEQLGLD